MERTKKFLEEETMTEWQEGSFYFPSYGCIGEHNINAYKNCYLEMSHGKEPELQFVGAVEWCNSAGRSGSARVTAKWSEKLEQKLNKKCWRRVFPKKAHYPEEEKKIAPEENE